MNSVETLPGQWESVNFSFENSSNIAMKKFSLVFISCISCFILVVCHSFIYRNIMGIGRIKKYDIYSDNCPIRLMDFALRLHPIFIMKVVSGKKDFLVY